MAVWQGDAHHEVLRGFAFAARATGGANAVTLGVNPPPLEVEIGPFRKDGGAAQSREFLISSKCSQGFLERLRRSTFWAFVSLICGASTDIFFAIPMNKKGQK